jgi:CubicO group peptidase (beta-lactamase class C family)
MKNGTLSLMGASALALLTTAPLSAAIFNDQLGLAWASNRDLTNAQFTQRFAEYRDRGYIITDVDAYPNGSGLLYSMLWQENTDGRSWAEWRNLTSSGYHDKWLYYRDRGYRPLDVEGYRSGNAMRYAGIWVENREALSWYSYRDLTGTEYAAHFDDKSSRGYRLVDMEAYQTPSGLRYAAIWYENRDRLSWAQYRDMDRPTYQQRIDDFLAKGYRVIDFESYTVGGAQLYAAIWERNVNNRAYIVRSDRTELEFANYWREYRDLGYRLVDFERYQTPSGPRYAGVWTENASRLRYPKRGELDKLIETYRAVNGIPGISVAIVRNGDTIYRRGFGFAEIDKGKQAHGETVYLAASVSKVIGGTLAAKLEDEGQLADGTPVALDLSDPTSFYLENLPAAHTHTVQDLLAHLGCVWHYDTGPEPPNGFYSTATGAAQQIWNTPLLVTDSNGNPCTVGVTREYSTHGFTFVGAVLEEATGRPIDRLVKEEIADRYGLSSLRAQFETSSLPSNYERAAPYKDGDPVTETSYQDSSWKVLGGGIEVSAVDLADFGWKTLDAQIVDAATRDGRLWMRVRPNEANGLAWEIGDVGGRRVAEHGGSSRGARSHLRVYRDDGLVIAILSNRRSNAHEPRDLATTIGDVVLSP